MVSEEKYRIRIPGGDTVKCDNLNKKMGSSRGCESHMQMRQPSVKKVFCLILHFQNSMNELQQIEENLKMNS